MPREHPIEQFRDEITQRTEAGESCEAVADAIRAQGFEVSKKTISRWRVTWGLRKRAPSSTIGRQYPDRKKRSGQSSSGPSAKIRGQEARKQEIIERTQRGETAEQIAEALQAQGFELKSGASTIWRLQTTWKLVPYEKDRARGKGKYDKKKQAARDATAGLPGAPQPRPRKKKEIQAPSNPGQVLHYPQNLANGPKRNQAASNAFEVAPTAYTYQSPYPNEPMQTMGDDGSSAPPAAHGPGAVPVNTAAELMSAEFLVDLATSTLTAANRVKELYLARQAHRPMPDSTTHLPPTDEDILMAKQKVREAAAVMHDLAMPTTGAT